MKDPSVRFRACQIIAEAMSVLSEDVDIEYVITYYYNKIIGVIIVLIHFSDELWEELSEKMILRTKDKAAITRYN